MANYVLLSAKQYVVLSETKQAIYQGLNIKKGGERILLTQKWKVTMRLIKEDIFTIQILISKRRLNKC